MSTLGVILLALCFAGFCAAIGYALAHQAPPVKTKPDGSPLDEGE